MKLDLLLTPHSATGRAQFNPGISFLGDLPNEACLNNVILKKAVDMCTVIFAL